MKRKINVRLKKQETGNFIILQYTNPRSMNTQRLKTIILAACTFLIYNAYAQRAGYEQTELRTWEFSKDSANWQEVTLPHSCNAQDGHSAKYYRGKAYYRCCPSLSREDIKHPVYLLFEGAAQAATVTVNGKVLCHHKGGYTPFVVDLRGVAREGNNEISVCTDNTLDPQMIPVTSDFNKNNGLHNPAFLLKMKDIYFSPEAYGMYRLHVSTPYVTRTKASTKVETRIVNAGKKARKVNVTLTLKNAAGATVYTNKETVEVAGGGAQDYTKTFEIRAPHLWDGLDDPYLYNVSLTMSDEKGALTDQAETKTGYRFYQATSGNGFYLNGRKYPLRGVAEHQDWDGQASAVTPDHTYADYQIMQELGINFIRMAHYPHNDLELRICDSLGIIVQTEIPWVNDCGVNATAEYFDNMHSQLDEMIRNLYNHPSIVFWGMWNEVSTLGDAKLQGKFDADRVVAETQRLYNHAKSLDPLRYVGLTDCTVFGSAQYQQLAGDYFSENRYPDWYQMGGKDRLTKEMKAVHERMGKANIAEYGGGCNPFCHTTDSTVMKDRNNDSRHYEEYACYLHESAVRQILKMPWLNFTSLWIMFDFPVAARHEGYIDSDDGIHFTENNARLYMNDKGLVTRDRQTKKDPFYLYKSLWNHKVTTVYITGRRRKGSPKDKNVIVKVYSNAKALTLYQNGEKVQRLEACPSETGVIWTFSPLKYKTDRDTFRVADDNGNSDEVSWSAL